MGFSFVSMLPHKWRINSHTLKLCFKEEQVKNHCFMCSSQFFREVAQMEEGRIES